MLFRELVFVFGIISNPIIAKLTIQNRSMQLRRLSELVTATFIMCLQGRPDF
jgi:hypothetical protein